MIDEEQLMEEVEEKVMNHIIEKMRQYEKELKTFDPYMNVDVLHGQISALEDLMSELSLEVFLK